MGRSLGREHKLILGLYEAATDASMLPSFVSAIGKEFDAHVTGIRIYDTSSAGRTHFASIGLSPTEWAAFDADSRWCDVWRATASPDLLENGVSHSGSFFPWSEFSKSTWYNEYAKRIDVGHGMGWCLWAQPPDQLVTISLNRSHRIGAFNAREIAFAKRLLPHFRSAYAIMRRFSWLEGECSTLASAVDRLRIGFVIADVTGKCLYRNEAADAAIRASSGLALSAHEAIRCTDARAHHRLQTALHLATQGCLNAPARIQVRDLAGQLLCVLVVTMMGDDLGSLNVGIGARAAIFIHLPSMSMRAPEILLQEAFELTPAEARIAALLSSGVEVSVCAESMGLSIATVRTHLRNLFVKTGTRRQAALITSLTFVLRAG